MSRGKDFLKHFTVIGSGTAINMLIGLLTTPLITRIVDPNEYGQLSIFTLYSNIAVMVLCLGLDQALVRYYYEHRDDEYKRALLFRCVKLPVLVTVIAGIVISFLSVSGIVKFEFSPIIMVFLCVFTLVQLIYRFSLLLVRLAYKSKLYSMLNIVHKAVYVVLALALVILISGNDLLMLVIATFLSSFVCMVVSIAAQAKLWNIAKNNDELCHVTMSELVRYSFPFIVSLGITTLFQALDQIALKMFSTYYEVGIYASTMTLVHIFAIVQTTFNTLWSPMAVEHYTKDSEDRSFYQKGNQIITVVMFFLGIMLILCKDVFSILLGEKYREAAYILPFLIFNPIMYTISETTVSGLVFMKKSNQQVIVAIVACITNAIGNVILVPKLGGQGAAISTGLSYIVFFTMRTVLSNRYFKVDFRLKQFYLLTAIVSVYALYNTFIHFNIGSVIGCVICLCALVLLYRKTVVWGIHYVIGLVKDILPGRRRKDGSE